MLSEEQIILTHNCTHMHITTKLAKYFLGSELRGNADCKENVLRKSCQKAHEVL